MICCDFRAICRLLSIGLRRKRWIVGRLRSFQFSDPAPRATTCLRRELCVRQKCIAASPKVVQLQRYGRVRKFLAPSKIARYGGLPCRSATAAVVSVDAPADRVSQGLARPVQVKQSLMMGLQTPVANLLTILFGIGLTGTSKSMENSRNSMVEYWSNSMD